MVTVADYAALSAASYGSSTVDGWQAIQTRSDPATGFSATLFQNSNGDLVLAFAGTNPVSLADWSNSINAMTTGTQPPQFNQAMDFYNQLVGQYGAEAISLTGHSLGGALASWVAAQSVSQPPPNTTVFNAFGILT